MKKIGITLGIIGSVLIALGMEWGLSNALRGRMFVPPFSTLMVLAWYIILPLPARLWLGLGAGFFLDTIGIGPLGVRLLPLVFLAGIAEILRSIVSHRESYIAKALVWCALVILFFASLPASRAVSGYLLSFYEIK